VLLLGFAFAQVAYAHDPGLSSAELRIEPQQITATLRFSPKDAATLGNAPLLQVEANGRLLTAAETAKVQEANDVRVTLTYPTVGATGFRIESLAFAALPLGHRQYLAVHESRGGLLRSQMLDAAHRDAIIGVEATQPHISPGKFTAMGVEHIWTGYDHIAFLFALLLVVSSFRAAVKTITAFTVAHSVTLALATYNVVSLSPRIVEPLIAVSIVYVGMENLFNHSFDKRWLLTFGFGLVHGLGFASALRDLGIGTNSVPAAIPLVTFNLGVEMGQLVIAAILLPLIWKLRERTVFVARFVPACSLVVAAIGSYWFVERTLLMR
jgi:hydrogenase/urease accessory protein HupE